MEEINWIDRINEVKRLRAAELGVSDITRRDLAAVLGCSMHGLYCWEDGATPSPRIQLRITRELARLRALLKPEEIEA